jgi:hypothetical protein
MIFSNYLRIDPAPRAHSETSFAHLDRRAGSAYEQVRDQMETWAAGLPQTAQLEIQARVQSGDDRAFDSAFFELYLHELLLMTGHAVALHPPLKGTTKRPDFLASSGGAAHVVIEASVVTETTDKERANDARLNTLYDAINERINSPDYWVSLDVQGATSTPIPVAAWVTKIRGWMNSLSYDELVAVGQRQLWDRHQVLELCHDDAIFFFRLIAKSEQVRGRPGMRSLGALGSGAEWVTSRFEIARTLRKKASRYGALEYPYVIAINCLGPFCDWEEIRDGIFGEDGFWPLSGKPSNTRVSAVFAAHHLLPWSITRAGVLLFVNPNATRPYSGPLTELPRVIVGTDCRPAILDGKQPREWFGLDESWPGE